MDHSLLGPVGWAHDLPRDTCTKAEALTIHYEGCVALGVARFLASSVVKGKLKASAPLLLAGESLVPVK
jgi:hypothetical protein